MSFCSPSYFPANVCCFACVSFHVPVLAFTPALPALSRTSPPKIFFEHACSRPLLQRTSFHIPLPLPQCTSFPSCIFLSRNSLCFRSSYACPTLLLTKSYRVYPLQVPPPVYFLPFPFTLSSRTSLYCGFYLYCVCYVFFFPFCFTGIFMKNVFLLDNLFFY